MRGEKTIEFEHPFQFSDSGEYRDATTVTVRAPGLGKFHTHTNMMRYVSTAVLAFNQKMGGKVDDGVGDDDDKPEVEDGDEDALFFLSMGLGEDFPEFALFVKKALTDSKLAYIGEPKNRVTDEVWVSIEETNGTDAALRILGEFASFFMDALELKSKKETGKKGSGGSASGTKARSTTKK